MNKPLGTYRPLTETEIGWLAERWWTRIGDKNAKTEVLVAGLAIILPNTTEPVLIAWTNDHTSDSREVKYPAYLHWVNPLEGNQAANNTLLDLLQSNKSMKEFLSVLPEYANPSGT